MDSPSVVIRVDDRARSAVIAGVRQPVDGGGREFVQDISALGDLPARALSSERMSATLAATLAGLALVLSFAGIFGVLAYSVSRRTREIGVRAAIGAIAAYAGMRILTSLMFGISPADPVTFGAAVATFLAIGLVAGAVPARRAARVDPAVALRVD